MTSYINIQVGKNGKANEKHSISFFLKLLIVTYFKYMF